MPPGMPRTPEVPLIRQGPCSQRGGAGSTGRSGVGLGGGAVAGGELSWEQREGWGWERPGDAQGSVSVVRMVLEPFPILEGFQMTGHPREHWHLPPGPKSLLVSLQHRSIKT